MKYFLFLLAFFSFTSLASALVQEGDTSTCTLPDGSFRQECMYMSVMPSVKMSPRVALQKDEWKLATYNGKTLDHAATIKIEKNRFHAKICNTMNGRYNLTITGKLIIRQGMSTMMYCEGDIMKVESLFGGNRFDVMVGSDTLTLTTKDGDTLIWKK